MREEEARTQRHFADPINFNASICCCTVCIVVIDAEKIDHSGQPFGLYCRFRMSTFDEITKEKQRIGEALARVEVQREKLTSQLGELEAAERVLARYNKDMGPKKMASAKTSTAVTKSATSALGRRQPRTAGAKPAGGKRSSPSLSDQVLALATGKTQQEITAACKGARPNHVGAAIARHKRAGRIEERDGKFYAAQSGRTEQHAAV